MQRIVLADDHALVRAGIRLLLEGIDGVRIVGEAGDGREALKLIAEQAPDIALLDISMPGLNGLDAAAEVSRKHPRTRVILLSMHADDEYIRGAFAAGAAGYMLKSADRQELEFAVRAVGRGEAWLGPGISKKVLAGSGASPPAQNALTPRQREVLQLIAEGCSTKEIANRLDLGVKTIETHRTQLMERLGVHGIAGLVRYAIRVGVVRTET